MVQLGFDVYQVAGHDVGMWVAYALASDHPEAVTSLALTEAVIPGWRPRRLFRPPEENIFLWHFMFNQLADLPETLIAGRERAYLEFMFNRWSFRRDCVAVDVHRRLFGAGGCAAASPITARFRRRSGRTRRRAQRKLTMPVLAIGAEHATGDAPLVTMRDNATDLQGAVVPDCGHFIMEEAPDAFIGHLLPFLERSR